MTGNACRAQFYLARRRNVAGGAEDRRVFFAQREAGFVVIERTLFPIEHSVATSTRRTIVALMDIVFAMTRHAVSGQFDAARG